MSHPLVTSHSAANGHFSHTPCKTYLFFRTALFKTLSASIAELLSLTTLTPTHRLLLISEDLQ